MKTEQNITKVCVFSCSERRELSPEAQSCTFITVGGKGVERMINFNLMNACGNFYIFCSVVSFVQQYQMMEIGQLFLIVIRSVCLN